MCRSLDPVKKKKYKRARNKGKTIEKALLEANYAPSTAKGTNGSLTLVKTCEKERSEALDRNKWSKEHFLQERGKIIERAKNKGDLSNELRALEGQEELAEVRNNTKIQVNVSQAQGTEQKELKERTNKHRGIPHIVDIKDNG